MSLQNGDQAEAGLFIGTLQIAELFFSKDFCFLKKSYPLHYPERNSSGIYLAVSRNRLQGRSALYIYAPYEIFT